MVSLVFYLDKDRLLVIDLHKRIKFEFLFSSEIVNNLRIKNLDGLKKALANFLTNNPLSPGTGVLLLSDNLVFQRIIPNDGNTKREVNKFLAEIPFESEHVRKKMIDSKIGTTIFATDCTFYDLIGKTLDQNFFTINAVVPLSAFKFDQIDIDSAESIIKEKTKIDQYNFLDNNQTASFKLRYFLIPLILPIIFLGGFFTVQSIKDKNIITISRTGPTITQSPSSIPTVSLTKATVKIIVLNGTGRAGSAGKFAEVLKEKGYQSVETGNADSYNYQNLSISFKESAVNFWNDLVGDLSQNYKLSSSSAFLEASTPEDIQIILGK